MSVRSVLKPNECAEQSFLRKDSCMRRSERASSSIGVSPCRFYGRAFYRNRTHTHRGCVRDRDEKKKAIVIPTVLFTEFLSFHRAPECVRGTHIPATSPLSRLVAGKIRQWPVSNRCCARESKIDRRKAKWSWVKWEYTVSVLTTIDMESMITVIHIAISNSRFAIPFFHDRCLG